MRANSIELVVNICMTVAALAAIFALSAPAGTVGAVVSSVYPVSHTAPHSTAQQ